MEMALLNHWWIARWIPIHVRKLALFVDNLSVNRLIFDRRRKLSRKGMANEYSKIANTMRSTFQHKPAVRKMPPRRMTSRSGTGSWFRQRQNRFEAKLRTLEPRAT